MSKINLTPAQKDVVRKMREGARLYHNLMFGNKYTEQNNGMVSRIGTPTFDVLLNLGIISKGKYEWSKQYYKLTDLGKSIIL